MSWKYGSYVFEIDPYSSTEEIEYIGDKIVTSSGRKIIEPTTYKTARSLSSVFYQPSTHKIETKNLPYNNIQCVDFWGEKYYLGLDDGSIVITNRNFRGDNELTPAIEPNVKGITFDSVEIWVLTQVDSTTHKLYSLSPVDGTISSTYSYSGIVSGLVYIGEYPFGYLYKQYQNGLIEKIDPSSGDVVGTYDLLTSYGTDFFGATKKDNYYITTNDNEYINFVDLTKNKIIDSEKISTNISDLTNISANNYFLISNDYSIYRINSVLLDLDQLEKEIKTGKVILEDDLGNQVNVSINNYNFERLQNHYKAFIVNLNVTEVG